MVRPGNLCLIHSPYLQIYLYGSNPVAMDIRSKTPSSSSNSTSYNGYGLWLGNTATTGYGKVIAQNCCFRGYRHTSNTSGVGYGIGSATTTGGQYNMLVLNGCRFDRVAIANQTQTGDVKLGSSSTIVPKYVMVGNIFSAANISVGGSNITGNGSYGATNKYMPTYANFFSVTN